MKKMLISGVCALALAAVFCTKAVSNRSSASMLTLQNIEALAEAEPTSVGTCYFDAPFSDYSSDWQLECNSSTSDDKIYPCPENTSYGRFKTSDRCTK